VPQWASSPDGGETVVAVVQVTCTADAADSSFPLVTLYNVTGLSLTSVKIVEGATPTDGTISLSVYDGASVASILGDQGTNITTTGVENGYAVAKAWDWKDEGYIGDVFGNVYAQITGGGVNSAVVYLDFYFRR
jgi:hypothetical protein